MKKSIDSRPLEVVRGKGISGHKAIRYGPFALHHPTIRDGSSSGVLPEVDPPFVARLRVPRAMCNRQGLRRMQLVRHNNMEVS